MGRTIALALAGFAATATPALAQQDLTCRGGLFADDPPFALAEVRGEGRAYFQADFNGCPWNAGTCQAPAYLVPGDTVVLSKIRKGFACAHYPGAKGGTTGWISTRRLSLKFADNRPDEAAWLGGWQGADANPSIRFYKDTGKLFVTGEAFWPGRAGTHDYPSIHFGELDGAVSLAGHTGTYGDDNDCQVRFTILGDYLVASDNRRCGGVNVTFSGVYRRERD